MRILAFLFAVFASIGGPAMAADEPLHSVLRSEGDIEIREYAPMIVAEVEVSGSREDAGSRGFRPLADYIFGNNAPRQSIDMTAPVTTRRGQSIDMTAPVTSTSSGDDRWTVAFIMPAEWTMETLPRPNNPAVNIREVPTHQMAVIKFRGRRNSETIGQHEAELTSWIAANGYEAAGEPVYASYSPPWTPIPLRRHEVMIGVRLAR